jgi:hypothetical protein
MVGLAGSSSRRRAAYQPIMPARLYTGIRMRDLRETVAAPPAGFDRSHLSIDDRGRDFLLRASNSVASPQVALPSTRTDCLVPTPPLDGTRPRAPYTKSSSNFDFRGRIPQDTCKAGFTHLTPPPPVRNGACSLRRSRLPECGRVPPNPSPPREGDGDHDRADQDQLSACHLGIGSLDTRCDEENE